MNRYVSGFPDFRYEATDIRKYHEAAGIFTMLLKWGVIIHYEPIQAALFRQWLYSNNIEEISLEE